MSSRATPDQTPPELTVRLARELLADARRLLDHPALIGTAPLEPGVEQEVTRGMQEACMRLRSTLDVLDGTALRGTAPAREDVRFSLSFREGRRRD